MPLIGLILFPVFFIIVVNNKTLEGSNCCVYIICIMLWAWKHLRMNGAQICKVTVCYLSRPVTGLEWFFPIHGVNNIPCKTVFAFLINLIKGNTQRRQENYGGKAFLQVCVEKCGNWPLEMTFTLLMVDCPFIFPCTSSRLFLCFGVIIDPFH